MGLFGGSIANNATDEHAAKYEELVRTGKIVFIHIFQFF